MKAVQSAAATVAVATAAILSLAPHVAQAQAVDVARDIAVLQTEMKTVKAAVAKNGEAIARNGEAIAKLDKKFAVLEEKMNGLQMQNQFFIIPLLLVMITAQFGVLGLLTRGVLWGKEPRPQSTRRAGDSPLQPAATRV